MALDGYLSDEKNQRVYYFPIDDSFHEAIFQDKKVWNSYIQLRKLKDYYGIARYNEKEVSALANDLEQYLSHINSNYHSRIKELINWLRDSEIIEASFYGD